MEEKKIKLGVIGLGRAFMLMLPTFLQDSRVELVAAMDPRDSARKRFSQDFHAASYDNIEDFCADPRVEVVYIASPHQFHAEHARYVAQIGKHILLEKPLAISMTECHDIVETIEQTGVVLVVGHSHSFNGPVLHAKHLIDQNVWGPVQMIHAFNYTDFLYRPRRPEELDTSQGGGVIFSQAAHQIDMIRLLGGGLVKTVQAKTGSWDPARPTEGAYSALLTFENGAYASATYSGYGHYDSDELLGGIGEMGFLKSSDYYGQARRRLKEIGSIEQESALKEGGSYGSENYQPPLLVTTPYHQHFGHVLVSMTKADLRIQPNGVMVYSDEERYLENTLKKPVPRAEVIDELFNAIFLAMPVVHSAQWARATTEVCLAILNSARTGDSVQLQYQVAA